MCTNCNTGCNNSCTSFCNSGCSSTCSPCQSNCSDGGEYIVSITRDDIDSTVIRAVSNLGNITEWHDAQIRAVSIQNGKILVDVIGGDNVIIDGGELDFQYLKTIKANENGSFDITDSKGLNTRIPAGFPTRVSYNVNEFTLMTDDGQSITVDLLEGLGSVVKCVSKDCDGNYVFTIESSGACGTCIDGEITIPAATIGTESDPVWGDEKIDYMMNAVETDGVITLTNGDGETFDVYTVTKVEELIAEAIAGLPSGGSTPADVTVESVDYTEVTTGVFSIIANLGITWNDDTSITISATDTEDAVYNFPSGPELVFTTEDTEYAVEIGVPVTDVNLFFTSESLDEEVVFIDTILKEEEVTVGDVEGFAIATDVAYDSATIIYTITLNGNENATGELRQGDTVIASVTVTEDVSDAVYYATDLEPNTEYTCWLDDEQIYAFATLASETVAEASIESITPTKNDCTCVVNVTSTGQSGVLCQWRNEESTGLIGSHVITETGSQTVDYPNDNLNPNTQYYFGIKDNHTGTEIETQMFSTPSS